MVSGVMPEAIIVCGARSAIDGALHLCWPYLRKNPATFLIRLNC
jgi:hypothetical protein